MVTDPGRHRRGAVEFLRAGGRTKSTAALGGSRAGGLPRRRRGLLLRLRLRPLRGRRGRGDRAAAGRRRRRRPARRPPSPRPARLRDAAAGAGDPLRRRPAHRRQRPPHPHRPRRRERRRRPRRLRPPPARGGESFGRTVLLVCLPFVLAAAALAWLRRERLAAWLRGLPAMRAGMLGALAATAGGHPRQRLRRPPARDRRRLPARLHRVCLGRKRRARISVHCPRQGASSVGAGMGDRSSRLSASCESPLSRHIPGATRAA